MGFAFYGGRRDSLGIVYFFDKLHIATNINSSPIRLLSGGLRIYRAGDGIAWAL